MKYSVTWSCFLKGSRERSDDGIYYEGSVTVVESGERGGLEAGGRREQALAGTVGRHQLSISHQQRGNLPPPALPLSSSRLTTTSHHLLKPVTPGRGKCPGGRNYWGPLRARQQRHRSQQSEWTQSGERESRPGIPNQWVQSGNLSQSTLRTLRLTEKHREKLQQLIWLNRVAVRGMVSQKVRFPTVMNILIMR